MGKQNDKKYFWVSLYFLASTKESIQTVSCLKHEYKKIFMERRQDQLPRTACLLKFVLIIKI